MTAIMEAPLADRMRPRHLDEFVGQTQILGPGKPLRHAIESGRLHSMIFWGPPGTGKTTLARMVAASLTAQFISLSAVLDGVKQLRAAVQQAQANTDAATILFVDEVHRFNKAQQDAFLPHVEDGTLTLIGATTENPAFELNNALLSRARILVLQPLSVTELAQILAQALADPTRGLGRLSLQISAAQLTQLAQAADGDARRALNLLDLAADLAEQSAEGLVVTTATLESVMTGAVRRFDKQGDVFYDQISALHKSVRGSAPDAALYWLSRMLDAGCDPLYIARRVVRMASEDIGNADPRALTLALEAWQVQQRLGSPEGELAIAQAVLYLACAAKSNAVYAAYKAARKDVQASSSLAVPKHLRNAPTRLAKGMGHGAEYRYAHDQPGGYAAGENYFPEGFSPKNYYQPVDRGLEIKIAEKLAYLKQLDQAHEKARSL